MQRTFVTAQLCKFFLIFFSQMDATYDGRSGRALRRRLDTGCEHEGEATDTADLAHHSVPDKFHPTLCRARTQEQMEASQCDHESHGPQAGRLVGEDHPKLSSRCVLYITRDDP